MLVDQHIPNKDGYMEKFDPAEYAKNISLSGAKVAYVYSSNCLGLSFFPSKYLPNHQCAKQDVFGQTVKELRKLGISPIGYFNSWMTFVADMHPEWNAINSKGISKRDKTRFASPCNNNPEFKELMKNVARELAQNYDLDGLWLDMIGINTPVCYCEACKKKYFDHCQKELPTTSDVNSPELISYFKFKRDCVEEYVREVRDAALEINPRLSFAYQCADVKNPYRYGHNGIAYHKLGDYLSGDFYFGRSGPNTVCRLFYRLSPNLPFEYMTSRCSGELDYHTMTKNIGEISAQAFSAMMHKGSFVLIDAIDPSGEMNKDFYRELDALKKSIEPYIPHIDYSERALRSIAVYFSFESALTEKENENVSVDDIQSRGHFKRVSRLGEVLSTAHLDYDVITKTELERLSDYDVLILSDLEMLSQDEISAFREYTKNGGSLYVSGKTSLKDDDGNLKDNFMLSDVLGVDYLGRFDYGPNYIAPELENKELFSRYSKKYPYMLKDPFIKVKAKDPKLTLASVTLPISSSSDRINFSSAISDPPMIPTDHPALYLNSFGKGKALYCAASPETDPLKDTCDLFCALVKMLLKKETVKVEAPEYLDHTVYEKDGVYKIHLLNYQSIFPPVKLHDIKITLDLEGKKPISAVDAFGAPVEFTFSKDSMLEIKTDLEMYKLIIVKTK